MLGAYRIIKLCTASNQPIFSAKGLLQDLLRPPPLFSAVHEGLGERVGRTGQQFVARQNR